MNEGRKIVAILVADIAGYSRLMGADEEGTLSRLRALRSALFLPAVEAHGGRVVNRRGDGAVVEFRSVVEAVRCALEITKGLAERNASLPPERRIEVRAGIHLGDVIETQDGDLYGDAVNIAARLESICAQGGLCLSEDAWRQVRDRLPETFVDLGERELKNIVRPMRVFALGGTAGATPAAAAASAPTESAQSPSTISAAVVGVLESVARLKDSSLEPSRPAGGGARPVVAKAVGILRTIERVVDAVADRSDRRDAEPPDSARSTPRVGAPKRDDGVNPAQPRRPPRR